MNEPAHVRVLPGHGFDAPRFPQQSEPGPFAELPDITPEQLKVIFAFAARRPANQPTQTTQNP